MRDPKVTPKVGDVLPRPVARGKAMKCRWCLQKIYPGTAHVPTGACEVHADPEYFINLTLLVKVELCDLLTAYETGRYITCDELEALTNSYAERITQTLY